jgi:hypothetical protein
MVQEAHAGLHRRPGEFGPERRIAPSARLAIGLKPALASMIAATRIAAARAGAGAQQAKSEDEETGSYRSHRAVH